MTLENAMSIFQKTPCASKVYGYWIQGDNIVLNTCNPDMPHDGKHLALRTYQYIITPDGDVIPTNPAYSRLNELPYVKL